MFSATLPLLLPFAGLARTVAGLLEAVTPRQRRSRHEPRLDVNPRCPSPLYDAAGRIPYEDIC